MNSQLLKILAEKHREVERLRKRGLFTGKADAISPIRDFKGAISTPNKIHLIAEIKFASPSAGIICENGDPLKIARMYEEAGASAISLLTDKLFFGGDIARLPQLRKEISLPILRKDFILDEIQVRESFIWGADAILLIARILSRQKLRRLLTSCYKMGMAALTEIHDQNDLKKAIACGAHIIGINNRDLDTFKVSLNTTLEVGPLVPERRIIVSESGIKSGDDIRVLKRSGIHAVLVGTSIMRSDNVVEKVKELVRAGYTEDGKS